MRVTKPQTASLLTRPFEFRRKRYCGLAVLGCAPLGTGPALIGEQRFWADAAEHLETDWVLDEGMPKRTPEFLVAGSAWAGDGVEATECEVSVQLGPVRKIIRVTGDRHFIGRAPSAPVPFRSMRLAWQRACGGEGFEANPLGRGAAAERGEAGSIHLLPNLEYPNRRQRVPGDPVPPACLGPVDIRWPPRAGCAGRYGRDWLDNRYPGLADDIDWKLFNLASPDQHLPGPLAADERYRLCGLHPARRQIDGMLPGICARAFIRRAGAEVLEEPELELTTVWFLPEAERAILVWHGVVAVDQPDASDLDDVLLAFDWRDRPRPPAHFADALARRADTELGMLAALDDRPLVPDDCPQLDIVDLDGKGARLQDCPGFANAWRQFDGELRQSREDLEQAMHGIDVELPAVDPDSAALVADLERLDRSDPEQLIEFRDRLDRHLEIQRRDLERLADDGQRDLDGALKGLGGEHGGADAVAQSRRSGPPQFNARDEREAIETQLASADIDEAVRQQLREGLCNARMDGLLEFAESAEARAYRLTAHQRPALSRPDRGQRLRKRLAEAVAAGEDLAGRDFCGADLAGMDLSGCNLAGIYLEAAKLDRADLTGARLDEAVLAHASLQQARADKASFAGANLGKAVLTGLAARGARFSRAVIEHARLDRARLEGCAFEACELRGASLHEACLTDCDFNGVRFVETALDGVDFSRAGLADCLFHQQQIDAPRFDAADLAEATFYACVLTDASFRAARMRNARFVADCDLSGADFSQAFLGEAMLSGARLSGARFEAADLGAANLRDAVADGCRFVGARLTGTQFIGADLRGADFTRANLMQASLERCDARGAVFHAACLFESDLALIHVDRQADFGDAMTERMRTLPRLFPRNPEA